jgi:hypothetical protein
MKKIKVVSTFNQAGYELYGKKLIDSWSNWPKCLEFKVYQEGFKLENGIDLLSIDWLVKFKSRNSTKRFSSFRWDAVRFAHKTAAVIDAAKNVDYLIWMDGDIFTHEQINESDIEDWLPSNDEYISWLWRRHMYPECGFYVINVNHPVHERLMSEWLRLYETDDVFKLSEWHDSFVLKHLILTNAVKWKSLSGDFEWDDHPFVNGPLGAFMDHSKGDRKVEGKASLGDLLVVRKERYWRERLTLFDPVKIYFRRRVRKITNSAVFLRTKSQIKEIIYPKSVDDS